MPLICVPLCPVEEGCVAGGMGAVYASSQTVRRDDILGWRIQHKEAIDNTYAVFIHTWWSGKIVSDVHSWSYLFPVILVMVFSVVSCRITFSQRGGCFSAVTSPSIFSYLREIALMGCIEWEWDESVRIFSLHRRDDTTFSFESNVLAKLYSCLRQLLYR